MTRAALFREGVEVREVHAEAVDRAALVVQVIQTLDPSRPVFPGVMGIEVGVLARVAVFRDVASQIVLVGRDVGIEQTLDVLARFDRVGRTGLCIAARSPSGLSPRTCEAPTATFSRSPLIISEISPGLYLPGFIAFWAKEMREGGLGDDRRAWAIPSTPIASSARDVSSTCGSTFPKTKRSARVSGRCPSRSRPGIGMRSPRSCRPRTVAHGASSMSRPGSPHQAVQEEEPPVVIISRVFEIGQWRSWKSVSSQEKVRCEEPLFRGQKTPDQTTRLITGCTAA